MKMIKGLAELIENQLDNKTKDEFLEEKLA